MSARARIAAWVVLWTLYLGAIALAALEVRREQAAQLDVAKHRFEIQREEEER